MSTSIASVGGMIFRHTGDPGAKTKLAVTMDAARVEELDLLLGIADSSGAEVARAIEGGDV